MLRVLRSAGLESRRHFAALPRDEYPTLVDMADDLAEDDVEGLLRFGFDAWVLAIERLARRSRRSRR